MEPRYPALAEVSDVEVRVERTFRGTEADRVEALINSISVKVRRASGRLWLKRDGAGELVTPFELDPAMPETVWDTTVTAVERAVRNPDGYSSESSGDYSYQRVGIPGGVGGLYLTDDELEALGTYKSSNSGLWSLGTTRNELADQNYLMDTRPGTEGFLMTDELDGGLSRP